MMRIGRRLTVSLFTTAAMLAFGVAGLQAQACSLLVAGYFVPDAHEPDVRSTTLVSDRLIKGTSAYAINQTTRKKYLSAFINGHRRFGKIPAGDYKVYISKPGYKTSV